jgi:signal transduction histidine kinase
MRKRAERRGGTLDVGSRVPRGTTVAWSVPNT